MFRVSSRDAAPFFGRDTYLTVSGQLNLEAYCLAMSKVYTFGPHVFAPNIPIPAGISPSSG